MASADSDSDSDFGYDLSLEDENLLANLVDGAHAIKSIAPATRTQTLGITPADARDGTTSCAPSSSPRGKPALVGLARTTSLAAFVRKTRPQSMPSVIPEADVQYPDRTSCALCRHHTYNNPD